MCLHILNVSMFMSDTLCTFIYTLLCASNCVCICARLHLCAYCVYRYLFILYIYFSVNSCVCGKNKPVFGIYECVHVGVLLQFVHLHTYHFSRCLCNFIHVSLCKSIHRRKTEKSNQHGVELRKP